MVINISNQHSVFILMVLYSLFVSGCANTDRKPKPEVGSLEYTVERCLRAQNSHGREMLKHPGDDAGEHPYKLPEMAGLFDMNGCMKENWPPRK